MGLGVVDGKRQQAELDVVLDRIEDLVHEPHAGAAQRRVGEDYQLHAALCPSENADDDLVEGWARPQQEAGLDRPACDFDEGTTFGYVAEWS